MEAIRTAMVAKSLGASVLVLLVLVLAACGGGETKSGGVSVGRETAGLDSPAGPDLAQTEKGANTATGEVGITEDPATLGDFGRKVVKTANLGLRTKEVRQSAARAQQVPSAEFERVLDDLRSLGDKVTTDSVSGQDVTEEYVDLKSRERNLRATEESLLRLYDRAQNVEEALSIQRELTNVRGEIEMVQGRIKYLDQHTAYSQITLDIQPVTSPPPPRPAWDPGGVAARAWAASLSILQAIATALISAIVFGWWLVPLLVGGLLWWWRRRNRGPRPPATEPS